MSPYDIITSVFSKDGFSNELFSVKFKDSINIKIEQNKEDFLVSFIDSKPTIKINKYVSLSLTVNSILLRKNSGVFQIDYFPDIPFRYDWIFGENNTEGESNELQ